jgi:hypothetical protein
MKPRCLHLLALACLILVERPVALAQEKTAAKSTSGVEAQLRDVMMENIKSTQAEDADATMKTIHSKSPVYQASKKQVSQLFGKHMGLKYELISLKHIATDGDYAIARVRQRTTQTPPKNIKNNEMDMLVAFRQEGDTWKFWNQAILQFKYLNP